MNNTAQMISRRATLTLIAASALVLLRTCSQYSPSSPLPRVTERRPSIDTSHTVRSRSRMAMPTCTASSVSGPCLHMHQSSIRLSAVLKPLLDTFKRSCFASFSPYALRAIWRRRIDISRPSIRTTGNPETRETFTRY
ncbi:hypothetical protein BC629DRAFT_496620 [Irpex lacteus]|nr:hypothetical protein BC629DRAFT_496620 [Irpex lacteus]